MTVVVSEVEIELNSKNAYHSPSSVGALRDNSNSFFGVRHDLLPKVMGTFQRSSYQKSRFPNKNQASDKIKRRSAGPSDYGGVVSHIFSSALSKSRFAISDDDQAPSAF